MSLLLLLVLAAGLAAGLGALVMHAGARIGAESDAAIRLARELVETKAPQLASAADPHAELEKLFADVRRLRHVRIVQADAPQPAIRDRVAPEWFTTLVMPAPAESRIVTPVATIVVSSNPLDEIDEVWQELVWLATGALALALVALALGSLGLSRALRPVAAVADSLSRLEGGDYAIRLAPEGPPEFVDIAERINALATKLQRLDADNRALMQRMIGVQEQERRDIARDLHDEIGPFLFTARASIGALARKTATQSVDPAQLASDCAGSIRRSPPCRKLTAAFLVGCGRRRLRKWGSATPCRRWRAAGGRRIPKSPYMFPPIRRLTGSTTALRWSPIALCRRG